MNHQQTSNKHPRLPAEYVGKAPCCNCGKEPMKLPGSGGGLCIPCYAAERVTHPHRTRSGWTSANFVSDPCLACGSRAVDANGWAFWCDNCHMQVAVALPY